MESLFVALGCVVIEPTNPPTAVFGLKEYARLIVEKPWSVPCYLFSLLTAGYNRSVLR